MAKTYEGTINNKERTKKKLVSAVSAIIKEKGFAGLNRSQIGESAKVDRTLIHKYFGGMEGLISDYLNSRDFWKHNEKEFNELIGDGSEDMGRATLKTMLEKQMDSLQDNEEMRKIITWGLCENSKPLQDLNTQRENFGEHFFTMISNDKFKSKERKIRLVTAILVGSIYYMTLLSEMNGGSICGIDLLKDEDREDVKKTIRDLIDWSYH